LGSTSLITNQSGSLVENTTYDPWGEVKIGGTASKFLYTGQEKDSETNLNYYNARYYDSHIRRFTQPDDIIQDIYNPQGLNRYSYVWNNPLRYTDPTGRYITIGKNGTIGSSFLPVSQQQKKPQTYQAFVQAVSKPASSQNSSGKSSSTGGGSNLGSNGGGGSKNTTSAAPQSSGGTVISASYSSNSTSMSLVKGVSTSKTNSGTIGICGNGSAGLGVYGTASACAVYSISERKFGVTGTLGGGGTTGVTLGAGVSGQYSNSKKFSDLLGQDVFTGGSAGEGIEVNGNLSWSRDNTNNRTYEAGVGLGGNFSLPTVPGELNGGSTYTWGFSQ